MAARLIMRSTSLPAGSICTALSRPSMIGPMVCALPSLRMRRRLMLPASSVGKISRFGRLVRAVNGKRFSRISISRAISACTGPSTISSGSLRRMISRAWLTFCASGLCTEPKVECDSNAMRGSSCRLRNSEALIKAMAANSSAVGLTLTLQSAMQYKR